MENYKASQAKAQHVTIPFIRESRCSLGYHGLPFLKMFFFLVLLRDSTNTGQRSPLGWDLLGLE